MDAQAWLVKDRIFSAIIRLMSPCTHIWSAVSFMDSSWSSIFHFLQGYGKQLPRGFHLSNCHISKASQGEWIVEVCQKPTHPPLLFQFHFFFSWPLFSGFKLWKKTRGKAQHCCYRICCPTECRATSDTLQLFCIIQAFSCSFSQSGTPSNIVWV